MSDTKLTPEIIDWADELIEKKEFLHLEKTGVTICVIRLTDKNVVVGNNSMDTDASDLEARYQSAFEHALKIIAFRFNDYQDETAG